MLALDCSHDLLRIGTTLLRIERHDTHCCRRLYGTIIGRNDIPPMPDNLDDHAQHAQRDQKFSFANSTKNCCTNCDNYGKQAKPRHERDD